MKLVNILCTAVALSVATLVPAKAEEVPEPYTLIVNKGVLCDTEQEVQVYLSMVAIQNGTPQKAPSGCGNLRQPVPFMVTPLYWYETPVGKSLIAKMRAPNGWTQYAYIAFVANPDYKAPSKDEGA